jgi:hypothetical protein
MLMVRLSEYTYNPTDLGDVGVSFGFWDVFKTKYIFIIKIGFDMETEQEQRPEFNFNRVYPAGETIAGNPGLAHWILDCEVELQAITRSMKGWGLIPDDNTGELVPKQVNDDKSEYSDQCILWFQSCLRKVLNKNTYLSRINKEEHMDYIAYSITENFLFEVLARVEEYELTEKKILWLGFTFQDFTDFATRRPLYQGERDMLTKSTSESTQRVQQDITQSNQKKSWLPFGIGGN